MGLRDVNGQDRVSESAPPAPDHRLDRLAWQAGRARRHLRWAREHGIARLVEEDGLDPRERVATALAKARWRRSSGVPVGTSTAVFLVGVQRSGTNMLVRGLERAPEVAVHSENSRRAFDRFRLRDDDVVTALVRRSRHRLVLFKPLCDSHRVPQLLDLDVRATVALWAHRTVEGRVRSALAKFGDANLQALRAIATTGGHGMWQAGGLGEGDLEELRRLDPDRMTPATASAMFWLLRNRLYFSLGLDRRPEVLLTSYEGFVAAPEAAMRRVCDHLGFPWRPQLTAHVASRENPQAAALEIDPRVRRLCDELQARLDQAAIS